MVKWLLDMCSFFSFLSSSFFFGNVQFLFGPILCTWTWVARARATELNRSKWKQGAVLSRRGTVKKEIRLGPVFWEGDYVIKLFISDNCFKTKNSLEGKNFSQSNWTTTIHKYFQLYFLYIHIFMLWQLMNMTIHILLFSLNILSEILFIFLESPLSFLMSLWYSIT